MNKTLLLADTGTEYCPKNVYPNENVFVFLSYSCNRMKVFLVVGLFRSTGRLVSYQHFFVKFYFRIRKMSLLLLNETLWLRAGVKWDRTQWIDCKIKAFDSGSHNTLKINNSQFPTVICQQVICYVLHPHWYISLSLQCYIDLSLVLIINFYP